VLRATICAVPKAIEAYLEIGHKRTFAGALEWPGWCRSGRDETAALEALAAYGPRYATALKRTRLGFTPPDSAEQLKVAERLEGDASTDFGAPGIAPRHDSDKVSEAELERLTTVLRACWRTFDAAVEAAKGKQLQSGPRGGGRDVGKIVEHVLGAEGGYLSRLAWKVESGPANEQLQRIRKAVIDALTAAAHGEVPEQGPRGGKIWTPRYFTRRVAWHVLDHAWEIEDRTS
jgi:hypothetical protein